MKLWRTYSGHAWEYVDKLSFEPLARRICRNDASVPMSSSVQDVLGSIEVYMPTAEDYEQAVPVLGHWLPHLTWIPRGELMCILALIIWVTNVMVVFSEVGKMSRALWFLDSGEGPRGQTKIVWGPEGGELVSLSKNRKSYM